MKKKIALMFMLIICMIGLMTSVAFAGTCTYSGCTAQVTILGAPVANGSNGHYTQKCTKGHILDSTSHRYNEVNVSSTGNCYKMVCKDCGYVNGPFVHSYTNPCPTCGTANVVCSHCGTTVSTHTCATSDTTPPTATGITLSATYTNTGIITATAQGVTDDLSGVSMVQWYVIRTSDWTYVMENSASDSQWTKNIDVSAYDEGGYVVGIVVWDNAGNYNDTTQDSSISHIGWIPFCYDKTPPVADWQDSSSVSTSAQTHTATVIASDAISGIQNYTYELRYGNTVIDTVTTESNTYTLNLNQGLGTYTLIGKVTDRAGNVATITPNKVYITGSSSNPILMESEYDYVVSQGEVSYAIGAKRSGNTTYTANLISSITFVNNKNVPSTAEISWDASYNEDNSVIAWLIPSATNSNMYDMYIGAENSSILAPEDSSSLFKSYTNLTTINNLTMLDTSLVTDMSSMFFKCYQLTSLDLSNFNTSNVTDMNCAFFRCESLTNIDISSFDTSSVTNFSDMFSKCNALLKIKLGVFNTDNATTLSGMFSNCTSLKHINLNPSFYSFDTSNVKNFSDMFYNCKDLISINLGYYFNTDSATTVSDMFYGCTNLSAIILSREIAISDEAMSISGSGLDELPNAIIYVKDEYLEAIYEESEEYITTLTDSRDNGGDLYRVRQLLEVNGENPVTVSVGATYDEKIDKGATVAGFTKENASIYIEYGYNYTTSGLPVDTSTAGSTEQVTYTLIVPSESEGIEWTEITRDVEIRALPKLMVRESHDSVNGAAVYYALGAKRAGLTEYTSDLIGSITFVENINVPSDAEASWDVSYEEDNGVLAWIIPNGDLYDLYIGANATVIEAPEDSSYLFKSHKKCTQINNIGMLDTSNTTNFGNMFQYCHELTSLDLTSFNTKKVTNFSSMFSYCISLNSLNISSFETTSATDLTSMFDGCHKLEKLDLRNFNTQNVTNMFAMFYGCSSLTSLDVSSFDTSNVTTMHAMFYGCSSLTTLNLTNFNTSKITDMNNMFAHCSSLTSLDLSNFSTSKVTDMSYMFWVCSSLKSINLGADFDKLTGVDMFTGCSNLTAIITPRAELMSLNDEATTSTGLKTLTNAVLYVPNTTAEATFEADANYMDIFGADRIRPILEVNGENPVTVKVGATYDETVDAGATVAGFTKENASEYTQYGYNYTASGLPVDTSAVGTKQVTYTLTKTDGTVTTNEMTTTRDVKVAGTPKLMVREKASTTTNYVPLYYAIGAKRSGNTKYTADLISSITFVENTNVPSDAEASWDVSYTSGDMQVIAWVVPSGDLYDLYIGADDTVIEAPEDSSHLFIDYSNSTAINNMKMLNTSLVTDMSYMFHNCGNLTSLDLSNFDTSKVTNMDSMFYKCLSLTSLYVSNFNTSNVTNMNCMFWNCVKLTSLDVSNFDTSNVTNMVGMFCKCLSLTSLDVSGFDTSKVTSMNSMFYNCSNLTSLNVNGFDTSNVTTMYSMFNGCSGLQSLDLSNFDTSKVTKMNYMFFTCIRLKSINIGPNFDRLNGEDMFTNCLRLTAIITPRTELLELSDEATISTGLKARSNIVLYVPSTTAEATFEANANYMDIFGADRIRPILEVNGENPVTVKVGATYDETVDAGATVAGFTKENASEYTQYGYDYLASGLPVDTSAEGTKQVTYTLTKTDANTTTNGMTTTRDVTVKILNMAIATVTIAKDSYEYIGSEIKPEIIVKMGSQTLTENINYDVDYKNNTNVGTATIVITGKGDYEGIIEKTFEITKRGITIIANSASKVYDGTPLTDDGYITGSDWSKLEVGDYVVLPQDTNKTTSFDYTTLANSKVLKDNYGITSSNTTIKGEAMNWRVLDIDEETGMILLTTDGAANIIDTVSGKETGVIINGDVGFVNAISELNRICEELFSITYNGKTYVARSLNAEDINALENYDEKSHYNGYRWAFYPKNAADTPDVELNGKIYPGTRCSTSYFVNGMHTFYMWNHSVTGEKIMSTSITDFKIPTNNSPVLVESNCYRYALSQKIGNALGNKGSWLATSAVNVSNEESANWAGFRIMVLESTESGKMVLDSYYVHASSGGYGSDYSLGIRPVISINAGLIDFSDDEKDGTTLETAWELKGGSGLVLGHKETVTVEGSQTEAGMSDNVITSVTIEDANGNDVTGNYDVKKINGNLLVTPEGFEEVTTELTEDSFEYDGTAKEPEPIVKDGDKVLKKDEDYELGYENNINASSGDALAKIYIIGKGNYTGTKELTFEITKKPITIKANDAEKVYDSTELKCDEYTITNGSLVSTHTMQVTIVGSQLLAGSSENIIKFVMITDENGIEMNQNYDITLVNGTLTVTKASIAFDIAISGDAAYGERLEALIENLDPEGANISYKWYVNDSNSTEGGTLLLDENGMPITGEYYTIVDEIVNKYIYVEVVAELENYEEKIIKKVVGPIVPANINLVDAYLSQTMYTYDGTAKEPIVFVTDNRIGKALTKDIDYTLEYKNNIDAGTASVIVKGVNNYDGEVKLDFKIIKLPKVILTNMNPDWTKDSVPIEISITDEGEGVEKVMFRRYIADASYLEETVEMNGNVAMVYAVDNGYYACVVTDVYGNEVTENINISNIDKERPIINSVTYDDTTFVTSVSVSVSATDYDSGIYGYGFSETMTEPSNWISFNPVSNSLTFETEITKNGKYYLFVRDIVGNVTMYSEQIVIKNVDNEAPVIKSFDIAEDYTFMADVFISIKAQDDTGVESLLLSNTALSNTSVEESTEWIPYTETVLYRLPMVDGEHTVYAWVRDAVGKISEYAFDKTLLLSKYIGNSGVNNTTFKFLVKDENYDFTRKLTESNIKVLVKDEDGNVTYSSDYGIDITAISLPTVYGPVQQGTQVLEGEYYTITVQNIRGEGTVYLVFDENAVVDLAGNKLENAEIETDVIVELNAPTIKIVDDEIQVADVDNHLIQAIKINGKTVLLSGGKITLQKLDSEYGIVLKTGDIIEAYDMCGNIGSMEFDENN